MKGHALRRVVELAEAVRWIAERRQQGARIVFTNGVFDLLHPGHVRYLQQARQLGDVLVVGINSDRSVRALEKGPHRPINGEAERAEVVAALAVVDVVIIFDEDTPRHTIDILEPDVLVKGADWAADAVVGSDLVTARGGQVTRIALADGYSTTTLIAKARGRHVR